VSSSPDPFQLKREILGSIERDNDQEELKGQHVSSSTREGAGVYVKKRLEERFVGEQETTVITGEVQVITKKLDNDDQDNPDATEERQDGQY
jgi:hypothetical protein